MDSPGGGGRGGRRVGDARGTPGTSAGRKGFSVVKALELDHRTVAAMQLMDDQQSTFGNRSDRPQDPNGQFNGELMESATSGFTNRLSMGPSPKVPRPKLRNQFQAARRLLPIAPQEDSVIKLLTYTQVVLIKGDTGAGKSTQVPQFILDDATLKRKKVRILVTSPSRIACVSNADRVARERGETLGYTVGYQLPLESCYSPVDTLLTYCTSGVLVRSLALSDQEILGKITHLIIDEVGERDRRTDLLLTFMREVARGFPALRIILMGTAMDHSALINYFGGPPCCYTLVIPGPRHLVKVWHLEDVLELLGGRRALRVDSTDVVTSGLPECDEVIDVAWTGNAARSRMAILNFLQMVKNGRVSVNYQHTVSKMTILMVAAGRGPTDIVKYLLASGADPFIEYWDEGQFFSAMTWAFQKEQWENLKLLKWLKAPRIPSDPIHLQNYLASVALKDGPVDLDLALDLLILLHLNTDLACPILVFLPSYEQLVDLKDRIFCNSQMRELADSFVLFLLHSNVQSGDQKAAFEDPERGKRKILLSTRVTESSLSVDDAVFVIDCGKDYEKVYDTKTGRSHLRETWISKASAIQRKDRAGHYRAGTCFRLYTTETFEAMQPLRTPEVARRSLQVLALYTRAFLPDVVDVTGLLQRLPLPPTAEAIEKTIEVLTKIGAFDKNQQMTKLGLYLMDFPVEPSLGKALIYAVVLKCLDPVLSLISMMAYRDPFNIPKDPAERQRADESRFRFACFDDPVSGTSYDAMSDHLAVLKAFQNWEQSKMFSAEEKVEKRFCRDRFLSSACFELVYGIRSQLLGQLRACGFVKSKGAGDLRDLNINSNNWALVKGILTAVLFPNVCFVDRQRSILQNKSGKKIGVQESSAIIMNRRGGLLGLPSDWIVYDEKVSEQGSTEVRGCTAVSDFALILFAGHYKIIPTSAGGPNKTLQEMENVGSPSEQMYQFSINNWIAFKGSKRDVDAVLNLRHQLHDRMLTKLARPSYDFNMTEDNSLRTVTQVLVYQDELIGLDNVPGIGQWPKMVSGNMLAAPRAGFDGSQVDAWPSPLSSPPNSQSDEDMAEGSVHTGAWSMSGVQDALLDRSP